MNEWNSQHHASSRVSFIASNVTLAYSVNCVSVDRAECTFDPYARQEDDFREREASETVDARLVYHLRVSARLKDKNGAKEVGMRRSSNAAKKPVIWVENNTLDL